MKTLLELLMLEYNLPEEIKATNLLRTTFVVGMYNRQ